jgi:hypothetical protein
LSVDLKVYLITYAFNFSYWTSTVTSRKDWEVIFIKAIMAKAHSCRPLFCRSVSPSSNYDVWSPLLYLQAYFVFILVVISGQVTVGCRAGWLTHGISCYYFSTDSRDWVAASVNSWNIQTNKGMCVYNFMSFH